LKKLIEYMSEGKLHWDQVYRAKSPEQMSWTQAVPQTSLDLIRNLEIPKDARIVDIGGGDSKLVDFLLADGYEDITVLDISDKALNKAKKRLGSKAAKVTWITSDIIHFSPEGAYDLWHDRAVFHFLTTQEQIDKTLQDYLCQVLPGLSFVLNCFFWKFYSGRKCIRTKLPKERGCTLNFDEPV